MTRRPPTLLARTALVTFATVCVVLAAMFAVLAVQTRDRVRAFEADKLAIAERLFATVEARRERDQFAMIATLAENPTLKAALDTFMAEHAFAGADSEQDAALTRTIVHELENLAATTAADVLAIVDGNGRVFTSAGPRAADWSEGTVLRLQADDTGSLRHTFVLHGRVFLLSAAPLSLADRDIGTLIVGTEINDAYVRELSALAQTGVVVVQGGTVVARTVSDDVSRALARAAVGAPRTLTVGGNEYTVRPLIADGSIGVYTVASIDDAARAPTLQALRALALVGIAVLLLAGAASLWLARAVTRPINRMAAGIARITTARDLGQRLPLTGGSREIDALTRAFNELLASVAKAEADTHAAYLGAVRALAAALDARDEYTAGHSERVSEIAVRLATHLRLPEREIEVIRFGALLHDIGKIGVSDAVLRKPGALTAEEFDQIKRHPSVGAEIIRNVPILAPFVPIVELHHEQPDGRGYPFGLGEADIPLAAHIVHVADTFDAMTSARAYRPARAAWVAIAELQRFAGTQFDRACVEAMVAIVPATGITGETMTSEERRCG